VQKAQHEKLLYLIIYIGGSTEKTQIAKKIRQKAIFFQKVVGVTKKMSIFATDIDTFIV